MTRISVTAEVVGSGSDGTEPSLLFSVQRHGLYSEDVKVLKRYLFNCGEGTQRLAGENGIKLSSLDAMYFTHFDVKSVSGVPGVIFALGSCGAARLKLHGPVGLRGFLGAIRSFVRRKYPQIQCVEIAERGGNAEQDGDCGGNATIECETWNEGDERTDQHACIIPIALEKGGADRIAKSCLLCEKNAPKRQAQDGLADVGNTSLSGTRKVHDSQVGRRRDDESDEHERWRTWLVQYYTAKVPAKIPYVDVVLNQYRGRYADLKAQLCGKYGDIPDETRVKAGDTAAGSSPSSDSSPDSDSDGADAGPFGYAEKPLDRRWLEKFYGEHQPGKLSHVDRVLRQFSGREDTLKQMLMKKYGDNLTVTSASSNSPAVDDSGAPSKRRKLLGAAEAQIEAPREDAIPKIHTNEDSFQEINSPPSDDASSSICYAIQFQYDPYPVVWIIDCRTPDNIADLEHNFSAATQNTRSGCCGVHLPSLVVHLSPAQVQSQPRYKQWMASLYSSSSRPEHLVFDGAALQSVANGAFSYAFVSSAKAAVRMGLQSDLATGSPPQQAATPAMQGLAKFLKDASWSAESPCRRQIARRMEGYDGEAHVAQSKLQFCLLHPKLQLGFNYERTGWHQRPENDRDEDAAGNTSAPTHHQVATRPARDVISARKLIVLGTGSAAPSKLRASSGIYLELSGTNAADVESMLVDCGEGTFGQLWRQFGSDVSRRIGGLRCIWISHNHADHHCGLVRVLYEFWQLHRRGNSPRPLVVIAPQSVLSYVASWLPQFLCNDSDDHLIQLVTCSDFNDPRHPLRYQLLSSIGYAVTNLRSVRVFHCYDSYGLVLTLQGGKKFVYSGDTKPCNELVLASLDAELLVHEATFDDSMEQDAAMKKHSTVGQALDIARRMRARQIVLTHFSQRYPSLPPPVSDGDRSSVLCAFDGFVHAMPF
ncbi:hypothetical protein PRIC1_008806 [Phytophthora ramorum]